MCAVIGEMTARAFWHIKYHLPFRGKSLILYVFYPELREVDTTPPTNNDDIYDVLLLGGSVFNKDWGPVAQGLLEQLASKGFYKVRIFNLSMLAHTSRDSWLKYASLGEARFDLVIFYHGINETRANNVPPELFRKDYGHYSWYETINELASYHKKSSFALPQTFRFLTVRIQQLLNKNRHVPTHLPRQEWIHYGRDYRSAVAFESNLRAILDLALQHGERVLLMTFAVYVPEDYSLEAFREKRLNYTLYSCPIEVWGKRENVIGTVAAHNEIISRLSKEYDVLFVDQASLMKDSARYFNDPCHFTLVGSSQFVKNMLAVIPPDLKNSKWNPESSK